MDVDAGRLWTPVVDAGTGRLWYKAPLVTGKGIINIMDMAGIRHRGPPNAAKGNAELIDLSRTLGHNAVGPRSEWYTSIHSLTEVRYTDYSRLQELRTAKPYPGKVSCWNCALWSL